MYRSSDPETITWNDDGETGKVKRTSYEGPCYKPTYAIKLVCIQYCVDLITQKTLEKLQEKNYKPPNTYNIRQTLNFIRPKLPDRYYEFILKEIESRIPPMLEKYLSDKKLTDSTINDYTFLALLGKKKNWRKGCAICLIEDIMGTTCGCGHTETIVFRPCGHSICKIPCFKDFIKQKGITLETRRVTYGTQQFVIPGDLNADLDTNFECPVCRGTVTKTFEGERVHFESSFNLAESAKEIYESICAEGYAMILFNDEFGDLLLNK